MKGTHSILAVAVVVAVLICTVPAAEGMNTFRERWARKTESSLADLTAAAKNAANDLGNSPDVAALKARANSITESPEVAALRAKAAEAKRMADDYAASENGQALQAKLAAAKDQAVQAAADSPLSQKLMASAQAAKDRAGVLTDGAMRDLEVVRGGLPPLPDVANDGAVAAPVAVAAAGDRTAAPDAGAGRFGLKPDSLDSLRSFASNPLDALSSFGDKTSSYEEFTGCKAMTDGEMAKVCVYSTDSTPAPCVSGVKCCGPMADKGHGCLFMTFLQSPDQIWLTVGADVKKLGVFQARVFEKTPEELLEAVASMVTEPICVQPLGVYGSVASAAGRALEASGAVEENRVGTTRVCVQVDYDRSAATAESLGALNTFITLNGNCRAPPLGVVPRPFEGCKVNCNCQKVAGLEYNMQCTDCEDSWNCGRAKGGAAAADTCAVCNKCSGCKGGECERCLSCGNCDYCKLEKAKHSELCSVFGCSGPYAFQLPRTMYTGLADSAR